MAVFARVVEAGSFSRAAQDLGMSKSAVSKQVARLEDRLRARLLNRTTRRIGLTEVGTAFYERCARILTEVQEAEEAVSNLQAEPRGTLRVNAPMSFGIDHLAPCLPDFMARHPDLVVDITLNDRVVDLIDEGFDVGVRITRLPDSSLVARRLAPFRSVVCAAPDYWRRHPRPAHPADLAHHNCLIYTYMQSQNAFEFDGPDGPLRVRVDGTLRANNGDVLRNAAVGGLGVYIAPTFIVGEELVAGRLEAVLHDYTRSARSIYAVYPHNRHLSAKVRVFVDFLARRFGDDPYWDRPCEQA
ncbi:MAG: LysR family transcriptional regulator [Hyphomicrobiales bacterium]|nr:LysR family transcriptional regulator [Hyphomicrobiales bacterium]MCP5371069.1 LysR family transcriptional regulator [Hyphomicrobiales bacterium]